MRTHRSASQNVFCSSPSELRRSVVCRLSQRQNRFQHGPGRGHSQAGFDIAIQHRDGEASLQGVLVLAKLADHGREAVTREGTLGLR